MWLDKTVLKLCKILPRGGRKRLRYRFQHHFPQMYRRYDRMAAEVRKRGHVNVGFVASSISMWRYGGLCELLCADDRFSVKVAIHPFFDYSPVAAETEMKRLQEHFAACGVECESITDDADWLRFKQTFMPDVLFYPQPYLKSYNDAVDWIANKDCLLCYIPYGVRMTNPSWILNNGLSLEAWRYYVLSESHRLDAHMAVNYGRNVVVVGEPRQAEFEKVADDPWKNISDGIKRKRVIWAPHFRVVRNDLFNRPDFMWLYDIMVDIAKQYIDKVQFAFKPHPALKTALYDHPDWGRERTDAYYALWSQGVNTQLEDGEYASLFVRSDAMIHNCGSFAGEYLYTRKPAAFTTHDWQEACADMSKFGQRCMDAHYVVTSRDEIERFIDRVVLGGEDEMLAVRDNLYDEMLVPVNGKSAVQNMYDDLVKALLPSR